MSGSFNIQERRTDAGECSLHNRPFECFSLDSFELICPSCLMFGPHKGANVCSVEEAAKFIREKLSDSTRKGLFKLDKTESVLLDIRQTKLTCDETKQKVLRDVEGVFNDLIKNLKDRKKIVMQEIEDHFVAQTDKIVNNEKIWNEKQEMSVDLLNIAKANNEIEMVQKGKYIMTGIEMLGQNLDYHTANILNSYDLSFKLSQFKGKDIDPKDLTKSFESYGQKGEIININYRC